MAGKKYILVAEDDAIYGNIFRTKLTHEGFDVEVAVDGHQALTSAKKRKPDLVIMDLVMPLKNGFETIEDMKKDPNLKNIKIIVLSNLGAQNDMDRAKKLGADTYEIKTNISIDEMVDKIRKYLG